MRFSVRVFFVLFVTLVLADVGCFILVFFGRKPLTEAQWSFLEAQRPKRTETGIELSFMFDGLNFALARRAVGGWETAAANVYLLVNLPAELGAHALFSELQARPGGTSKLHSDLATAAFFTIAAAQWALLALLLSRRRSEAEPSESG